MYSVRKYVCVLCVCVHVGINRLTHSCFITQMWLIVHTNITVVHVNIPTMVNCLCDNLISVFTVVFTMVTDVFVNH